MKNIALPLFACMLLFTACNGFLDTENLTEKDSGNFPASIEDIEHTLTAVYAANIESESSSRWQIFQLLSEVMADYTVSGGGLGDRHVRAISAYKQSGENMYSGIWKRYYRGIHRANFILENIDRIHWPDAAVKNSILGQTHFLRGQFYFDLARLFEHVPLVLTTLPENLPQATPEALYAQIFLDLRRAAELLPATPFTAMKASESGRVTRWAAQSMIGRAYLFYAGYYKSETIRLPDGTTLTKSQVVDYIDDCIANSRHSLLKDFRNLWPYAFSNEDYAYSKNNNLSWIGETGENAETVFAYKFSTMGSASNLSFCNNISLFYGVRGHETMPFARGWGWACVVPRFYDEWPDDDIRKKGTIWNTFDANEGVTYQWNKQNNYNETGYFNKKYIPINVKDATGKLVNYSCVLYGATPHFQYNNTQDMVIIRFSDVLLMGAELGSSHAQEYLDRVRSRAGLPSVPVTLENIKRERLYELAFEGIRYHDLMRWGDLQQSIDRLQKNVPVKSMGVSGTISTTFRSETKGFLPIPEDEIQLSNKVLVQNAGWGTSNAIYQE